MIFKLVEYIYLSTIVIMCILLYVLFVVEHLLGCELESRSHSFGYVK